MPAALPGVLTSLNYQINWLRCLRTLYSRSSCYCDRVTKLTKEWHSGCMPFSKTSSVEMRMEILSGTCWMWSKNLPPKQRFARPLGDCDAADAFVIRHYPRFCSTSLYGSSSSGMVLVALIVFSTFFHMHPFTIFKVS